MNADNRSCFVCNATIFQAEFSGRIVDGHMFLSCAQCGTVVARPVGLQVCMDYTDYGDYLIDEGSISRHLGVKRKNVTWLLAKYCNDAKRLLDFGAGAGYFVKAAQDIGLQATGVEPSSKLREFASERLGVKLHSLLHEAGEYFDLVTIFDVIEHVPEQSQRVLMSELVSKLKPGGILLGQTPNWHSVNRFIRGEKDPAIWPPSHISYFTPSSLNAYFESLGLVQVSLYTKGFRTFRAEKNRYSFLELSASSSFIRWCVIYPLLAGMKLLSCVFGPIGLGYHIYFAYKRR